MDHAIIQVHASAVLNTACDITVSSEMPGTLPHALGLIEIALAGAYASIGLADTPTARKHLREVSALALLASIPPA